MILMNDPIQALKVEIKEASDQLKAEHKNDSVGCVISLKAGCDMFLVQLTRVILSHHDDVSQCAVHKRSSVPNYV